MTEGYCGILLAAGRSTRFGADKLLHPLADGTPVGLASAQVLRGGDTPEDLPFWRKSAAAGRL